MDVSFIWDTILQQEGGFVADPHDKGGPTKYGISEKSFPHLRIKDLTEQNAEILFQDDYFSAIKGKYLLQISAPMALQLSDMAYNCGTRAAIKCLQYTLNSMDDNVYLFVDGQMTERVLERLNDVVNNHGETNLGVLFACQRVRYYASLPDEEWRLYARGWVKRTFRVMESSGISVRQEITDLFNPIINCLKKQETRLAFKKDVIHSINNLEQLILKR